MAKVFREHWKTLDGVFSNSTLNALKKLSSKYCFSYLKSIVSDGKESRVFQGVRDNELVAIKIYLVETCNFNKMRSYLQPDPRFWNLPKTKRGLVFKWVEREYRNLLKAWQAGVSVPKPLCFQSNVLVMSFIGDEQVPAPLLKHVKLSKLKAKTFFKSLKQELLKLYNAGMVHGDLSEYNILVWNHKPVLIDLSHATIVKNPAFKELWLRDLNNINNYFSKFSLRINIEELESESKT